MLTGTPVFWSEMVLNIHNSVFELDMQTTVYSTNSVAYYYNWYIAIVNDNSYQFQNGGIKL